MSPAGSESLDAALGLRIDEVSPSGVGWFDVDERTLQALGILHGGAYSAMAERLAMEGTRARLGSDIALSPLSSIDATFLRPVPAGHRVAAIAVPRHLVPDGGVWDVTSTDGAGRNCAFARVHLRVTGR
jgi:1,4-dihydroxy-2-naphthoyl-CoA hydrolase